MEKERREKKSGNQRLPQAYMWRTQGRIPILFCRLWHFQKLYYVPYFGSPNDKKLIQGVNNESNVKLPLDQP